ncbi:hypothetical protein WA026_001197 [Henosepilachna vigintioctopunctata]|uniref:Uncharacterized protein n=1 Tax=Henosepilachna vigintioctopunctata TaxID=420089 RepID=A0AAW1UJT5_9CUCU
METFSGRYNNIRNEKGFLMPQTALILHLFRRFSRGCYISRYKYEDACKNRWYSRGRRNAAYRSTASREMYTSVEHFGLLKRRRTDDSCEIRRATEEEGWFQLKETADSPGDKRSSVRIFG